MSMEHKTFVFDTETFHSTIEPVMKASVADIEVARRYICDNYSTLQSPYTGDDLDADRQTQFGELTIQEVFRYLADRLL